MPDWLTKVIKAEAKQLLALAAEDDELRAELRALAKEILAATEPPFVESDSGPSKPAGSTTVEPAEPDKKTQNVETDEPLRELTLGRSAPSRSESIAEPAFASRHTTPHDELAEIEASCRWKGEAARWAAERLLRIREGNDYRDLEQPMDSEMAEWADRLADCFGWAQASQSSDKADLTRLDDVAGCFETLAEALGGVDKLREKHQGSKAIDRMLPLVAEAQSALRVALKRLGAPDDPDQLEVFEWVKATAARQHVYLKRFMRADDLANPADWSELMQRIEGMAQSGQLSRKQASDLETIRDPIARIQGGEGLEQDWQAIIRVVDDLVEAGVPASSREIRSALLSVIESLPERTDFPAGFRLVMREIDRFLARRSAVPARSVAHVQSAETDEVARLLIGRSIVLIGGIRRRAAQEAMRLAFQLSDLIWIETKEHQSIYSFEPIIARADVVLVLLAIRWSSHAFGDVRLFCDQHAKPLVRLPGGYSPNQVAVQILAQSSGKLEGIVHEPLSRKFDG
jgi:hypothetical protein